MITESEFKAAYATMVTDPWRWLNAAQNLFLTAELMEPRIHCMWQSVHNSLAEKEAPRIGIEVAEYQNVYMMLIGFCIENLLKGYIIEHNREEAHRETIKTGKLPQQVRTHDLLVLANKCKLKFNELESGLLRRLTKHTKWIGRYPFASSVTKHYDLRPTKPTIDTGWSLAQAKAVKILAESIAQRLAKNIRREMAAR